MGLTRLQGHLPLTFWALRLLSLPGAPGCTDVTCWEEGRVWDKGFPGPGHLPAVHLAQCCLGRAGYRFPRVMGAAVPSFSESDSDLEPVGARLQHLQRPSQELDDAIVVEER